MPSMRCPECMGAAFEAGLYDIGDMYNGAPVVIRNAAGAKCAQCGYLLLPASVAKVLSRMLAMGYSHATVPARIFDLAETEIGTLLQRLPPGTFSPSGTLASASNQATTPQVTPIVQSNSQTPVV
jgi:hypothetical protein